MNTLHYYPMSEYAESTWERMADAVSHRVEMLWDLGFIDEAHLYFDEGGAELRRLMEQTERKE